MYVIISEMRSEMLHILRKDFPRLPSFSSIDLKCWLVNASRKTVNYYFEFC